MLRKRISSILVAGVVAISMTGCNMKEEYRQLLEHELQRIEEPVEYELPHMEQEAKDIENKVQNKQSREDLYKQVNEGKVEQEQPKQQSKNNKSNDKTPEQQVNDKEQVKQEINEEEQVKSGHTAYDESDDRINDVIDEREDYWETDGDEYAQPEQEYKSNEETNTSNNEPTNSPEVAEQYMQDNNLEEVNY